MLSYQMPGYGRGQMTVTNEVPLNVVSFGLGQLFAWAFGCGVHRFELEILKQRAGLSILMDALVEPGVIQAANCSRMGDMVQNKLLPLDIPQIERLSMEGTQGVAWDGQARCTLKEGVGMLIQTYDVRPNLTIAEWAFAFSDHITGFIWRGVRKVKVFHSIKLTQVHLSPALPGKTVTDAMTHAEDYPQDILVGSIK